MGYDSLLILALPIATPDDVAAAIVDAVNECADLEGWSKSNSYITYKDETCYLPPVSAKFPSVPFYLGRLGEGADDNDVYIMEDGVMTFQAALPIPQSILCVKYPSSCVNRSQPGEGCEEENPCMDCHDAMENEPGRIKVFKAYLSAFDVKFMN